MNPSEGSLPLQNITPRAECPDESLAAALSYVENSWRVYPVWCADERGVCGCFAGEECDDPAKHPWADFDLEIPLRNGILDATSNPKKIRLMFAERPGCNLGLATGRASDICALDLDPRHGGDRDLELLQEQHGELPRTLTHTTQSGGRHFLFRPPEELCEVPSRPIAPGLELKGDGTGIVLPPSRGVEGVYAVHVDAPQAVLPEWLLQEAARNPLTALEGGDEGTEPTPTRYVLPEKIYRASPSRNRELYRYGCSLRAHGWSHPQVLQELRRVNQELCVPPMSGSEVYKVARQAARHQPGFANYVTPEVLQTVVYLEEKAASRPKSGIAAHSRWAVYRALLATARSHGRLHRGRDVAVGISLRDLAPAAGVSLPTVQAALKALDEARLVYRVSKGVGAEAGVLALRVPVKGGSLTHSTPSTRTQKSDPSAQPATVSGEGGGLEPAMYRLRNGPGRICKAAAAVFEVILAEPEIKREELAKRTKKNADASLKEILKKLKDRGLVETEVRGRYTAVEGWEKVLERERLLNGEVRAERLDRARYERQRQEYRRRLAEKKKRQPQNEVPRAAKETEEARETERSEKKAPAKNAPASVAIPVASRYAGLPAEQQIEKLVDAGMARALAEAEVAGDPDDILDLG